MPLTFVLARIEQPGGAVSYAVSTPGEGGDGWAFTTNPAGVRRFGQDVAAVYLSAMTLAGSTFAVLNAYDPSRCTRRTNGTSGVGREGEGVSHPFPVDGAGVVTGVVAGVVAGVGSVGGGDAACIWVYAT